MKTERKKVYDEVDYPIEWGIDTTIEQIRKDLDVVEALGANEVDFATYIDYDDPDDRKAVLEITAYRVREENDEEYSKRVDEEAREEAQELARKNREEQRRDMETTQRELSELARLKAKYNQ